MRNAMVKQRLVQAIHLSQKVLHAAAKRRMNALLQILVTGKAFVVTTMSSMVFRVDLLKMSALMHLLVQMDNVTLRVTRI
jgi:hypothetical protein